ncbi:transcription elongation factor GreA [Arthrobacter sp. BL-252-APC-1A]|uniref:transcription elongation factor GreA n=1 Tax=Arthrobacter sp. BL-252-APC-1A TaxID=2606622 RepID=UPI0006DA169E|nr:transcription elongation factor GreA [Arthrobacter sp. BL-252-APC-1A]KPN17759.1 transcription elongation factor GreA [Arthrobacter sp. Edens01]MSR98268.1 transcription elongation factor GreA [Arthrobacter sp. BL-252-APC-1A]
MSHKERPVSTNSASVAWLTQESYDRLKAELEHLSGPGRSEIVARIEQARSEGDLKENGGYHAAKEEQGKAEARIRQLTQLLENAHVGEAPADDGVVEPGMLVEARIAGDLERFLLGSREIAGDSDIDVYSEKSPLGSAISGLRAGESTSYTAPNGKSISVEIVSATPYAG